MICSVGAIPKVDVMDGPRIVDCPTDCGVDESGQSTRRTGRNANVTIWLFKTMIGQGQNPYSLLSAHTAQSTSSQPKLGCRLACCTCGVKCFFPHCLFFVESCDKLINENDTDLALNAFRLQRTPYGFFIIRRNTEVRSKSNCYVDMLAVARPRLDEVTVVQPRSAWLKSAL